MNNVTKICRCDVPTLLPGGANYCDYCGGSIPIPLSEEGGERDNDRCAVCGWPLAECALKGCTRGNCSMRPFPTTPYDAARANREYKKEIFPAVAAQGQKDHYLKLLRWFKLFYGFYQKDIAGKPSACASALSEDEELQEFVDESRRID